MHASSKSNTGANVTNALPNMWSAFRQYIKQIILRAAENTLHSVLQQINYLSHNLDYADTFIMYFQCPKY